jgi:hypothetical protein
MKETLNKIKLSEAQKNSNLRETKDMDQPKIKILGSRESYHVLKIKEHIDTSCGSTRVFLA